MKEIGLHQVSVWSLHVLFMFAWVLSRYIATEYSYLKWIPFSTIFITH